MIVGERLVVIGARGLQQSSGLLHKFAPIVVSIGQSWRPSDPIIPENTMGHTRLVQELRSLRRSTYSLLALFLAAYAVGCSSDEGGCDKNAEDPARYVTVGFWKTTDCSGAPISTNFFPVTSDAPCYCWPGSSGDNSAFKFSCDVSAKSFTYTQHTTLTCNGGNTNTKTVYTDQCVQDVPPTLYAKILNYQACEK